MENKLEELTRKLYEEGLSKGKQEAETLLADAKEKAGQIVSEAKAEADAIVKNAQKNAEDLKKNTLTELGLAGRQTLSALKQQIEKMIITDSVSPSVTAANVDPAFIKDMLLGIASHWNAGSSDRLELSAVLPESQQEKFGRILEDAVKADLNNGLEITFDNRVKSGFRIGPKDGGYYISFSDEDFNGLLNEYLRPQVAKILFGE